MKSSAGKPALTTCFPRNFNRERQPFDWSKLRKGISYYVDLFGRVWYGYGIKGLQNVPSNEAVMIVFYHAALPGDIILFIARMCLEVKPPWTVVADSAKDFPNAKNILSFANLVPGGFDRCEKLLMDGQCLIVAPGGVYEEMFSDNTYKVLWGERLGFARLALKTKVKIIPAFTKNVRESWIAVKMFDGFWKMLYHKTKWNLKPVHGGLPVKLTTILGDPISIDDCTTATEVRDKIKREVEGLITRNQRIPGSIWEALRERFLR